MYNLYIQLYHFVIYIYMCVCVSIRIAEYRPQKIINLIKQITIVIIVRINLFRITEIKQSLTEIVEDLFQKKMNLSENREIFGILTCFIPITFPQVSVTLGEKTCMHCENQNISNQWMENRFGAHLKLHFQRTIIIQLV